jgi:gluconolactonase
MTRSLLICAAVAAGALAQEPEIAASVAFTEGPAADRDGNVYFTETVDQRIWKLSPDGKLNIWRENSNAANGLLVDSQNRLIACEGASTGKPRFTRTDLATGRTEVLAEGGDLVGPNDVTIDSKGRLYVTDLPGGSVYRIDAPGKSTKLLSRPEIQRPNGIQVSPDDKTLYLVEANQTKDGARMIRAYDLQPDGTVRNMRVFHNFYPGRSADGLCIDESGNVYAAAGLHRRRGTSETLDTKPGVHVFSPQGKLLRYIPVPEDTITNCAFGGPDRRTLYVTAGKTLWRFQVDTPGMPR